MKESEGANIFQHPYNQTLIVLIIDSIKYTVSQLFFSSLLFYVLQRDVHLDES